MTLEVYGVKHIRGVTYGYRGFFEKTLQEIIVCHLHLFFHPSKDRMTKEFDSPDNIFFVDFDRLTHQNEY